MGNRVIISKVKGITKYYAMNHIYEYRNGQYLNIVPDFDNPFDRHALAIYDQMNRLIGYVDKNINQSVFENINNNDYFCIISRVFSDLSMPGIEYQIAYKTPYSSFDISNDTFEIKKNEFMHIFYQSKQNKNTTEIFSNEELACKFFENGDNDKAIYYFEKCDLRDNNDLMYKYACCCDEIEEYEKAIEIYKFMISKDLDAYSELVYDYNKLKEWRLSFLSCQEAIKNGFCSYTIYETLSYLYVNGLGTSKNERLGFYYSYILCTFEDKTGQNYANLAAYYYDGDIAVQKNYEKAYDLYLKAYKYKNYMATISLGDFAVLGLLDEPDYEKAENYYKEALDEDEGIYYARVGLAKVYFEQGKYFKAIKILSDEVLNSDKGLYSLKCLCYLKIDDRESAQELYKYCIDNDVNVSEYVIREISNEE